MTLDTRLRDGFARVQVTVGDHAAALAAVDARAGRLRTARRVQLAVSVALVVLVAAAGLPRLLGPVEPGPRIHEILDEPGVVPNELDDAADEPEDAADVPTAGDERPAPVPGVDGATGASSDGSGLSSNASVAGDGRILFAASLDGGVDVYVMRPDGGGLTRLTDDPGVDTAASWSPDGRRIVFVSDRDGDPDLYVMDADGSNVRQLTDLEGAEEAPDWSPDGRRIAFSVGPTPYLVSPEGHEIYVVDAAGRGEPARLTQAGDDWWASRPDWSPDGRWIAYYEIRLSEERSAQTCLDCEAAVWIMRADGSDAYALDAGVMPEFSPDGRTVAYACLRGGGGNEVCVMRVDRTHFRYVTELPGSQNAPSWSPDGRRIVFLDRREAAGTAVYVIGADGQGERRLVSPTAVAFAPRWGPSGS